MGRLQHEEASLSADQAAMPPEYTVEIPGYHQTILPR